MLRIIDMRTATELAEGFAVWDTVRDVFLRDQEADQTWDNWEDFDNHFVDGYNVGTKARVLALLPDCFKEDNNDVPG